jgi:hypothetical protein
MSSLRNIEMSASLVGEVEADGVGWVAMSERDMQHVQALSEVLHGRRTTASAAAARCAPRGKF